MSETPGYTPKKITFLVLLIFFSSLFTGLLLHHQGVPLTIVLISTGGSLVIGLCLVAVVIRLSRPNIVAPIGAERTEDGKSRAIRNLRWLFFAGAIAGIYLTPHELIHALGLAKGSPQQIGAFIDIGIYIALTCYFLRLWWKSRRAPDSK